VNLAYEPFPPFTNPGVDDCSFCAELAGEGIPLHQRLIPEAPRSRVLAETRRFVVVPSIGPLAAGHVLVVPRRHALGILRLPQAALAECDELVAECVRRTRSLYPGPVVLFEHGSADRGNGASGACVEHAHLHLLPGPIELVSRVRARMPRWPEVRQFAEAAGAGGRAYLLVGSANPTTAFSVHYNPAAVPSQYFRQHYAILTGAADSWDWRKAPGADLFRRTIEDWTATPTTHPGTAAVS
jgi:diadenosine tetraphosphate (Ap4A) HIT family hydrolase